MRAVPRPLHLVPGDWPLDATKAPLVVLHYDQLGNGRSSHLPEAGAEFRHDEAAPETVQPYADRIPDVRWQMYDNSSHMPHIDEQKFFIPNVSAFLDSHD